jgi:hypothetical protein
MSEKSQKSQKTTPLSAIIALADAGSVEYAKMRKEMDREDLKRRSTMPKVALAKEYGKSSGCSPITPCDLETIKKEIKNLWKPSTDTFDAKHTRAKLEKEPPQVYYLIHEQMLLVKILGRWYLYMLRGNTLDVVLHLDCWNATVAEALWFLYYNELYTFVQRTPETDEERAYHSEKGNLAGFQHPDLLDRMGFTDDEIIKVK